MQPGWAAVPSVPCPPLLDGCPAPGGLFWILREVEVDGHGVGDGHPLRERERASVAAKGVNQGSEVSARRGFELFDGHGRDHSPEGALGRCGLDSTVMSLNDRSGTTARRALWFGGLLILLAGIVGMHGLDSHSGGMAPDVHAIALQERTVAELSAAPMAVHEVMATAAHHVAGAATASGAFVVEGALDGHMDMTAMCMAVLALGLTMLLRMLGGAPLLPLYQRLCAPSRASGPHGRDPDPPSLTALSIRRC